MVDKNSKLHPSKWKLLWKRFKFWMFTKRPTPLFSRRTCDTCDITFNKDLFKACPLCGHGDNVVWVVYSSQGIHAVVREAKYAKIVATNIQMEYGVQVFLGDYEIE